MRLVLEEVFGKECFKNEISWKRQPPRGGKASSNQFAGNSDTLIFFSKSERYTWNPQYKPYSQEYIDSKFTYKDSDGRRYRVGDIGL